MSNILALTTTKHFNRLAKLSLNASVRESLHWKLKLRYTFSLMSRKILTSPIKAGKLQRDSAQKDLPKLQSTSPRLVVR
jgi:hypothetical protein